MGPHCFELSGPAAIAAIDGHHRILAMDHEQSNPWAHRLCPSVVKQAPRGWSSSSLLRLEISSSFTLACWDFRDVLATAMRSQLKFLNVIHMQAARTLDITMHPSVPGAFSEWQELCRDLPDAVPTQAFRGILVSDVMVSTIIPGKVSRNHIADVTVQATLILLQVSAMIGSASNSQG